MPTCPRMSQTASQHAHVPLSFFCRPTRAATSCVRCAQDMGNVDDFDTSLLEQRLAKGEIIDYEWPAQRPKSMAAPSAIRKGGGFQKTASDEDSDLDG